MQNHLDELSVEDGWLSAIGFENIGELQKLQDKFSMLSRLFLYCVDREGRPITEVSGREYGAETLLEQIGSVPFEEIFRELLGSITEEQIVEESGIPDVKVVAQSIRAEGEVKALWLAAVVVREDDEKGNEDISVDASYIITEEELYTSLDFLRVVSSKLIQMGIRFRDAQAETLRSRFSGQEISESLRRTTAVMEIVQLLESEASIEIVLQNIMQIVGTFLEISSAQVFQIHGEKMDMLAEWLADGVVSLFDQTRNLKKFPLLHGDTLTVISGDTKLSGEEQETLFKLHVKSTVIVPLKVGGSTSMYVCFNECIKKRHWDVQDIKFIGNATRIMQNILIRRIQKNSLAGSYAALESILDHAGSAIYVSDRETGEALFANRILKRIFREELEKGTFLSLLENAAANGRGTGGSYELYHDAKGHWYDMYCTSIRWVDGRTALLYALYDITDKKVYQKKIEQQAYTDFLTGLYNRMCCERDLAFQIDEAKKSGKTGALLYLDLDDFKHINDGLGHQYGDVLLKAISHSFQHIHGIDNNCYRVGGDEFVIIIPPECYEEFDNIISDIKEVFSKPWFLCDADYYCTMSMGIVTFPDAGESVQELIKKADIAMYEAKKGGKNRIAYYSDGIKSLSNKRLDMEKNMRDATVDGYEEFEVYYQPIIAISHDGGENVCCGAEALIRWNSAELGFISPADFIPLAEYLGLINPIGNHVLIEACRQCKKWNDSGYPGYKVNVNLSVVQLLQPDIVEIIRNALEITGIEPENLTLEVTESLAINDMERMKEIIGSIRELGARIALDDFGTGYSSLNHIRELPFDVIKIDQSFVRDLHEDSYSQAFIRMVTELADAIDVNVCVEGIETQEQYEVVKDMPITMIQGYYFDKPMKAESFESKYAMPVCLKESVPVHSKEAVPVCSKEAMPLRPKETEKLSGGKVSEKEHAVSGKV